MEMRSKLKALVIDRGYNSLSDFAEKEEVSYYLLRRIAYNKANTLDVDFIVTVCDKLNCQIGDIFYINKEGA